MINVLLGSIIHGNGVKIQRILCPRLTLDVKILAVSTPERCSEILVLFFIEISPNDAAVTDISYSNAYLRVIVTAFRVPGHPDRTAGRRHSRQFYGSPRILRVGKPHSGTGRIIRKRRINRENRNIGIVETVETYLLGIRRPPESTVHRRTAEDFLVVNP